MIWMNGYWLDEASIQATDRGFSLGDGLFETMRYADGQIIRRERHEARLRASAGALGFPDPLEDTDLDVLANGLAERMGQRQLTLRFSVSAGSAARGLARPVDIALTRCLTGAEPALVPQYLDLALSTIRRAGSSFAARHKTLSYVDNIAARRQAQAAGADMALVLDTRGYLSGGDSANLFFYAGGTWHTPSQDCGVLPGTVRAALLDQGDIREGQYALSDLLRADAVVMSNAVMGVISVRQLGTQPLRRDAGCVEALIAQLS